MSYPVGFRLVLILNSEKIRFVPTFILFLVNFRLLFNVPVKFVFTNNSVAIKVKTGTNSADQTEYENNPVLLAPISLHKIHIKLPLKHKYNLNAIYKTYSS